MKTKSQKTTGFSLVELIVSVGIASLIMVGMSAFFSSAIKNAFDTQNQVTATQGQFVTDAIVQEKFKGLKTILSSTANELVALNSSGSMPVSYLGAKNGHLVFKDWLPFNKIIQDAGRNNFYGNSGEGTIKNANASDPALSTILRAIPSNFAGFAIQGTKYLVAVPDQNKVISCDVPSCSTPGIFLATGLNSPMDVATNGDGSQVFIADSGNNRVIMVEGGLSIPLASNLHFPTGLAYQEIIVGGVPKKFLFVSDTLNHQVKRIDVTTPNNPDTLNVSVVAGLGTDGVCAGTALHCDLDYPTGLFYGDRAGPGATLGEKALYIADSGHGRVVRVKDPGAPTDITLRFATNSTAQAIKKITVTFPAGVTTTARTALDQSNLSINRNGTFVKSTNHVEYQLYTTLAEDTSVTNACGSDSCPPATKITPINPNLWNSGGQSLQLNRESSPFSARLDPTNDSRVELTPEMRAVGGHSAGEEVLLATTVSPTTTIELPISGLVTSGVTDKPYSLITIKAYGLTDAELFTRYQGLTVGDGIVGTADDLAEILSPPSLVFPTGVSNSMITSTGNKTISPSGLPFNPFDVPSFPTFDYTSDFDLGSTGVTFTRLQSNQILQMNFLNHSLSTHLP